MLRPIRQGRWIDGEYAAVPDQSTDRCEEVSRASQMRAALDDEVRLDLPDDFLIGDQVGRVFDCRYAEPACTLPDAGVVIVAVEGIQVLTVHGVLLARVAWPKLVLPDLGTLTSRQRNVAAALLTITSNPHAAVSMLADS